MNHTQCSSRYPSFVESKKKYHFNSINKKGVVNDINCGQEDTRKTPILKSRSKLDIDFKLPSKVHSAKAKVETRIISTDLVQDQTSKEKHSIMDDIFASPSLTKNQREYEELIVFLGVPDYDY